MKPTVLLTVVLTALAVAVPENGRADSLNTNFLDANNAFWNGNYKKAVDRYTKLEEIGVRDPNLSYNLATAHARLGQLGKAVQYYERSLKLDPGHTDSRYNLGVIREFLARRASEAGRDADLAPAVTPWRAMLDRFSPKSAALSFLVFHLALFLVLVGRRFVSKEMPRLSLGVLAGVLTILTVTTLSVVIGKWHQANYQKEAVVIAEGQLDVMEGPRSTVKRFSLEEGSRINVLETQNTWTHVLDSEGRDGWAEVAKLGKI